MSVTKLFCLYKDEKWLSWDEKRLVEKPSEACRVSRTKAQRKYPGYVMQTFPEAYHTWFQGKERP